MRRKLIGYLKDGIAKDNYLSVEIPVFEGMQPGMGAIQIVEKESGKVKTFCLVDLQYAEHVSLIMSQIISLSEGEEQLFMAVYNLDTIIDTKFAFAQKIARFFPKLNLSHLNQFSIYALLNIRYEIFNAAFNVIHKNELQLNKTLSLENFTIPEPISISSSKMNLKSIISFYGYLTLHEKSSISFESLFYRFKEDIKGLNLNNTNRMIIGNYFMEINDFLSELIMLIKNLSYGSEDRLIKRFVMCFLVFRKD